MSTLLDHPKEQEMAGRPELALPARPSAVTSSPAPFGARLLSGGVAWSLAFAGLILLLDTLGAAAR